MSVSEGFRTKGNDIYRSALSDGLSPTVIKSRLQNAINLYYRAFETSENNDESSSAAKNLGMASWKMAVVAVGQNEDLKIVFFHFKDAFERFKTATEKGTNCKPSSWLSELNKTCLRCWENFYSSVSIIDMDKRIRIVESMLPFVLCKDILLNAYLDIAKTHFHVGITALQNGDYKKCMYQMKECYSPLEKVKEIGDTGRTESLFEEVQTMEDDIVMHQSIAESAKSRQTGDDLLTKVLQDEETLNIDMVWEIIDWYRQSIILTRDLDMEMEAIALSRLGRVYDKVLKLKYKSKECLMASVKLAEAMHPRTFNTVDWYIECTSTLKRYQEETVQHEEEERSKERAEIKEKMKEDLEALNKSHMKLNNEEFLKHVYKTYHPKNPEHMLEDWDIKDDKQTKKRLQKSILHFHPDKVDVTAHGMKWKIMCEEITKFLTKRYEVIKLCN